MESTTAYLLNWARRIAAAYTVHPYAVAAMVTGSVAEGNTDQYSDIDMTIYYADELPSDDDLAIARKQITGSETERLWLLGDRSRGSFAEAFLLPGGVECQVGHATVAAWERDMAVVLEAANPDTPLHKALSGTLSCIPLYGVEQIAVWKARAAAYPDALRTAMVEKHLRFFPLWALNDRMAVRDTTLWRHQMIGESAYNLLGVLAGLNRRYFSSFQFKRMELFVAPMTLVPHDVAARLEALLHADAKTAAEEIRCLVEEVTLLVETHLPHIDTAPVRRTLARTFPPWTYADEEWVQPNHAGQSSSLSPAA